MLKLKSILVALFISGSLLAQDEFQGVITYALSYDLSAEMKPYESMLPKTSQMMYRDKISKTTMETAATGGSTMVITDNEKKQVLTLMDNGMQKIAIRNSFEDEESEQPDYNTTGEKKEIVGYKCEVMEAEVEGSVVRICITKDLPSIHTENTGGLEGFPLEVEIETEQMTTRQTVSKIVEGNVPKLKLEVPSGYEEMTLEEYQKSLMPVGQ